MSSLIRGVIREVLASRGSFTTKKSTTMANDTSVHYRIVKNLPIAITQHWTLFTSNPLINSMSCLARSLITAVKM